MQLYSFLVNLEKLSVILKQIQSPRKFHCDHLYVSVINTAQLREIKRVIFFGLLKIFQTSKYIYICAKLS